MPVLPHRSLRTRLIIGLLLVVLLPGLIATIVGIRIMNERVVQQAQNKVRLDLNTAREIYHARIQEIRTIVEYSAIRPSITGSLAANDTTRLGEVLDDLYRQSGLDFLNVTDGDLSVVYRSRNPKVVGDDRSGNVIVHMALETGEAIASTETLPAEEILREGSDLADRARIRILPTPKAKPIEETELADGMVIIAAAPLVTEEGKKIGVIYGGDLLNRKYEIVDKIKSLVYQGERYEGKEIGTSTIFHGEVRVSTNVLTDTGERAIGTRVSSEVSDQVLASGRKWVDRAFVVNDWYITAYEPILDIRKNVVGILYVGILEKPFDDLRRRTVWTFLAITGAGMALALAIGYLLSRSILQPIGKLVEGAQRLTDGDMEHRIPIASSDEIGVLCQAFNEMGESLVYRDRQLKERMQLQLTQSEKLASIGRLAAGVAHEINTPLTGVLTYSSLMLEDTSLPRDSREDVRVIVEETTRCRQIVRNLLDFARETKPEIGRNNINELVRKTLDIVRKQSLFQNIAIEERLRSDLPEIFVDANQIRQVVMNLVLNAAEAMPKGGKLFISTDYGEAERFVKVVVRDTGCGIPEDHLERIFDPFFTTKESGKGTGLGLSVSYGIVQKHKGTITVTSQVGKGTAFEVNLPISDEKEAAQTA